ncbi:oligopeptide ABC transporter substrate-binding protein [Vagococcus coleopterorum]|uniref:Oligopeptide ABC transporter substrate-binding protein n=1 Tax=Vagococcus coleopterorum TaxID=2714946 RepID=A0A6G8AM57_9ENTE|nr:oligopeptide ABC transporter substrate-binding protein [Vagococcus coleopterorum]QIL46161.1 oligopeptide ABC transporter substrate-binding protein [Vagococcus coleopterorum]
MKRLWGIISVVLLVGLVLVGCGKKPAANKEVEKIDPDSLPIAVSNKEKDVSDGTLDIAMVMDSPFQGLFSTEFSSDDYDAQFLRFTGNEMFSSDENFSVTDDGAATLKLDIDNKTATITIKDGVTWSDGEAVKAEDIIYPYEIIASKDYTGIRYDTNFMNVVGIEDYHNGKADTISGIKEIDDKTVEISYQKMTPSMRQVGDAIWENIAPKHALKDIPIKDLESSDPVRKNPLSYGPYVISKVTPGESVEYQPNKFYFGNKPKLAKIVVTAVPSASIVEALKTKKYDIAMKMPTATFPTYKDVEGYEILGREDLSYTYLGFKMGKWDQDKGHVVFDAKSKMADVNLRKAIGYAMDNQSVADRFYNGLRSHGTTLIPPIFGKLHNEKIEGYIYDPEKSKTLLEEAGYKDVDGDGYVESPDGKELIINFASMSGGETAQPIADFQIQNWKDVGLHVELTTGRLIEFQSFYDKLKQDDPEVDMYAGAWALSSNPDPMSLYGPDALFNYSRYESKENDQALADIGSLESFDEAHQKEVYDKWQQFTFDDPFTIPTHYRYEVLPVSKRVTGLDWSRGTYQMWANVGVSSETR